MLNFNTATYSVYNFNAEKHIYYIKLELDGMYISGITVRKSFKNPDAWWVQMPTYSSGNKYGKYIEFNKHCEFKYQIESKCIEAVESYSSASSAEIDIDNIDFEQIPI